MSSAYVVRGLEPRLAVRFALYLAVAAVAVAVLHVGPVFVLLAAGIAGYHLWSATLVLRADAEGVRTQRFSVPWTSIRELVLTESDPPELAVRLRSGAPLPAGVRAVIADPADPDALSPGLRAPLPGGRVDRSRLADVAASAAGVPLRTG